MDNPTAASELVSKLESVGHKIDVLVNNAGYAIIGAVEQFSDEELRAQMETVYFGPSRLIKAVVPGMRERRFGVVVNVSSGAGLEGRESMGAYAAAKAAMDGMFSFPSSSPLRGSIVHVLMCILQGCVKCSLKKLRPSMSVS